uniref:Arf-GAP domain-containing protein n=1 Tax=Macrostomum lignano TaxID=282301 RepID=A0A1I8H785_9PLAT
MSSDSPADDLYGKIWEASSKDDREEPEPLFPPPPTSPPPPPPTCEPPLPPPPASASTDVAVRSTLCSTRYLGAPSDHSQLPSCVSVVMDAESGDELEAGSDENIYSDLTLDEKMRITSISEEDYLREGFMQMQYGYRWIKRYLRLTNYELFIYAKQSSIVSKKILPLSKLLDVRVNKGKLELALSMDRPITLVFRAVDDSAEETYDEPPETVWQNCIYSRIISLNLPPGFLDEEELGWAKVVGRHKYLFALNRRRAYLAYYRSDEEFRAHVQTHRMSLRTCLIKPNPTKSGLDLISASVRLTLQFEDSQRLEKFRSLVESAIRTDWTGEESEPAAAAATDASAATNPVSQQLLQVNSNLSTSTSSLSLPVRHQRSASDSSAVTAAAAAAVMTAVLKNESNRVCGDCGAANPLWASLNLCVTLCDDCSGHHRKLSTDFSKVHGLKFDVKVWTDEVVQLFLQLGNGASNSFWCHKEQPRVALRQFATPQDRLNYIVRKYVRKAHADDTPPLEFANSKPLEAVMRAIHLSKLDSVQHLISDNSLEKKLVDLNRKAVGEVLLWDQCITSGEQLWLCLRSNGLLCLYKQEMSVKEKLDCSHLCFLQLSGSFLQLATEAASFQLAIKERLSAWWHQLCRHLLPGLPDETAANQYNMVLKVTVQMAEFGSEPLDCILVGFILHIVLKALDHPIPKSA